jgi:hypothetical protein
MRLSIALPICAALLTGLGACASAGQRERVYVAPSNDTVVSTLEQSGTSEQPVHVVYVTNNSTVPITVFAVALSECENVRQRCEPHRLNVLVGPGRRQSVFRVEPRQTNRSFGFRYGFSWRVAEQTVAQ